MNTFRTFVILATICFASTAVASDQKETKQEQTQEKSQLSQKEADVKKSLPQAGGKKGVPGRRFWWHRDDIVEKIKLTDDQVKELDAVLDATKTEQSELRSRVSDLNRELSDQLAKKDMDEQQFMNTLEASNKARAQMYGAVILMKYKTRKVLTPEQVEIILKEYPQIFKLGFSGGRPSKMRTRSARPESPGAGDRPRKGSGLPPAPPSERK